MNSAPEELQDRDFASTLSVWDDPSAAPDTLLRSAFAGNLAQALLNWRKNESLIVALFGDWGTGKTWLLNQIAEKLESENGFLVCKFNPWQFESDEQITSEFFAAVSKKLSLDTKGNHENRAKLWATLGAMASVAKIGTTAAGIANPALLAASPIIGSIEQLMKTGEIAARKKLFFKKPTQTLPDIRNQLINEFKKVDSPKILVTLDDLDRLPDSQIQMIFRLLKTTVNIPNIHFLVLGERGQLAKALDPVAHNQGERYLEKIIQIPIHMPAADSEFLSNRLVQGLDLIAGAYGYRLSGEETTARYREMWKDYLKIKLDNLRVIHRLLTTVEFTCSALSESETLEVDLLDLLSIEYLRLYSPETYKGVINNISLLVHGFQFSGVQTSGQDEDNLVALGIIENSELGKVGAFHVLSHLFPKFHSSVQKWCGEHISLSSQQKKTTLNASERPIHDPTYFPLYFSITLDEGLLSRATYSVIVHETDQVKLQSQLLGLAQKRRKLLFEHLLAESNLSDVLPNIQIWLISLSNISDSLNNDMGVSYVSEFYQAYKIWKHLSTELPDTETQFQFLVNLLAEAESVTLVAQLLGDIRDNSGFRYSKHQFHPDALIPVFEEGQINQLSDLLIEKASASFKHKTFPLLRGNNGEVFRLLYAVGPARFEALLSDSEAIGVDSRLDILKAIALGLRIDFMADLSQPSSLQEEASLPFVNRLSEFASRDFWESVVQEAEKLENLAEEHSVLIEHIRRGLKELGKEETEKV
ncbi:MAG: KAP family P-loop NTPase fold protein [Opitutales bacterium]